MGEIILVPDIPETLLVTPFRQAAKRLELDKPPEYDAVVYERHLLNRFMGTEAALPRLFMSKVPRYVNKYSGRRITDGTSRFEAFLGENLDGRVVDEQLLGDLALFTIATTSTKRLRTELGYETEGLVLCDFFEAIRRLYYGAVRQGGPEEARIIADSVDSYAECMAYAFAYLFQQSEHAPVAPVLRRVH